MQTSMKNIIGICCLTLLSFSMTFAQTSELRNGRLRATFGASGATAPVSTPAFMEIQQGEDWVSLIYEMGLLIAGVTPEGETLIFSTRGTNLEGGIRGVDVEITSPWRVTSDQVAAHRADIADNGVIDDPIPAIFAWPGRANPFFEQYNGYDLIGAGSDRLASFFDENTEGIYNPEQGDYPILPLRGCLEFAEGIVPTELLLYPILLRDFEDNLVFQVFLSVFRFGCEEEGAAQNNSIFFHYDIRNYSGLTLEETYFGCFIDGDLGCYTDDYLGVFEDRFGVYFYNAQAEDADCTEIGENRFTSTPAAVGIDLYRGPINENIEEVGLSYVMPIQNGASVPSPPPAVTEPGTIPEYYNYLSGRWRDGQPLLDEGFGYESGSPASIAFTGDPVAGTGWTEVGEGNPVNDRKAIFSAGPLQLISGAVNEFMFSISYAQDTTLGHLEQITVLRDQLDSLQNFFDNCLGVLDGGSCTPIVTSVDDVLNAPAGELSIYPNPTRNQVNIEIPVGGLGTLVVYAATGQKLLQKRTLSDQVTLDLTAWPRGLYVLRWENDNEVFVSKLLVD